ncbi:2-amino-4-hydroxy-6-hydroxymethyldihydropteridine diphosphokinase [Ornithinibacillus gellani]|uniref:2-amino-4-hydroxy-6- hydroxymethyldihydropteridine diphosphokinase n=1 Tax=Ornithinibacillus gellani TaxID=2293253 RepID=UPI000F472023|nr:2-amino-4-hydroxy-6-hydroxymethyldihydropteridine diphosphokinase [Ornithinibacillus gellani]TQS75317.1 2-amino-4-hydroxy-6-hydroxymethyldihydropteridine diphosphokinase [Ornithinibacillus gellani]
MKQVFIALGTNIEPRLTYLSKALARLKASDDILIKEQSSIYETAPVGYTDQADFLNMVIEIKTTLAPLALLDVCQEIEQDLGRERKIRFGPRTIDLDILLYDDVEIKTERLIAPHPRMHERAFVLVPLAEIAAEQTLPNGEQVNKLLGDLPENSKKDVVKWTEKGLGDV